MQIDRTYQALVVDHALFQTLEWEEIGYDDPTDRLLTTVLIGRVPHHLEAIAVEDRPDPEPDMLPRQVASSDLYDEILEHYQAADMGTDEPFLAVEIGGRRYCLFMTPYRE